MCEKMREEFDAWTIKYGFDDGEHMWQAWQAPRAALVVELPEKAALMSASSAYAALDDAGVAYK